ncbi:hypothetical protein, partial [Acidiphilium sp.]|uniref:hypothetical protein n=1 Tax=Acidiphilium sp. TaxID=527 RepID=UPI003D003B67
MTSEGVTIEQAPLYVRIPLIAIMMFTMPEAGVGNGMTRCLSQLFRGPRIAASVRWKMGRVAIWA